MSVFGKPAGPGSLVLEGRASGIIAFVPRRCSVAKQPCEGLLFKISGGKLRQRVRKHLKQGGVWVLMTLICNNSGLHLLVSTN